MKKEQLYEPSVILFKGFRGRFLSLKQRYKTAIHSPDQRN